LETKNLVVRNMGLLGDFAKGFVIMTVVFWIFAVIEFVYIKQIALAMLFLIGLTISLSIIGYEHLKKRKKDRTQSLVKDMDCDSQTED
jgi:hypothetical protein